MKKADSIITYVDYGKIVCDIQTVMKKRNLSKNQVVKKTGLHHQVIQRYMDGNIARYDRDILAKLCYVFDCKLSEILYYSDPIIDTNKKK